MTRDASCAAGSVLLVVLLVTMTLVLVGTAFLMTAQTEGRIASNEAHAVAARYAAEAGARAVKGWFERPRVAPGFPIDLTVVIRDRAVLDEADPYGAAPTRDGTQYKLGVDLDADGDDDLFRPPFRGASEHELRGAEGAPDMRIEDERPLDALSAVLFGDAARVTTGLRVRIAEIAVFAPPYLRNGSGWERQGVATIKVVARVERLAVTSQLLAERTARLVLNEVPYRTGALEALHACGDARLIGPAGVRWGALVVAGDLRLTGGPALAESLPRALPGPGGSDRLWTADPAWVAEFSTKLDPTQSIEDPWGRILVGGVIEGAPPGEGQPWAGPPPPPPGTAPPWDCCDRSNVFHNRDVPGCPRYDYALWKRIARSGFQGAHYYTWHAGEGFRENGRPPGRSFDQIFADARGEPALRFFETADARVPADDDGDGYPDNLTPPIRLGGRWAARGFVIVHARSIELNGLEDSLQEELHAPGEPIVGATEAWVDLLYPDTLDAPFHPATPGVWDPRGPGLTAPVAFRGVLVNRGSFVARNGGTLFGSVVAQSVLLDGSAGPATRIHRDPALGEVWPAPGWNLPRFFITRFAVD
jgi:hypothetical protein